MTGMCVACFCSGAPLTLLHPGAVLSTQPQAAAAGSLSSLCFDRSTFTYVSACVPTAFCHADAVPVALPAAIPVTPPAATAMPSVFLTQQQNSAIQPPAGMPLPSEYAHQLQTYAAMPPGPVPLPSEYAHQRQSSDLYWQRPPPGFGSLQQTPSASATWGFSPHNSANLAHALASSPVSTTPWRTDVTAKLACTQGKAPVPRTTPAPRAPLRCRNTSSLSVCTSEDAAKH